MRFLLDTVALYRAATAPHTLSADVSAVLTDNAHELFVSTVSAWEMAIKTSIGKLALPCQVEEFFAQAARDLLAETLPLDLRFIAKVATLPHHHGDPFDRMIIAQALVQGYTVISSDEQFASYGVRVLW
ncbi:MAG: type II toxin-antitoxin system VapC family toxin [Myxococcales bacterium]|nr:type II toxin-antitoxin system VapC family toxin [Myxococcales bacterium]